MKKFNSLEKAVSTMEAGKKINGKHYPLIIIQEMQNIKALKVGQTYETITKEVADICILCGLQVKSNGIGWQITKRLDKLLGTVYG
jgi:hypothetical protein